MNGTIRIIEILMNRDGVSFEEAKERLNSVRESIETALAVGDYDDAEEIIMDELGLEMDYVFDILDIY